MKSKGFIFIATMLITFVLLGMIFAWVSAQEETNTTFACVNIAIGTIKVFKEPHKCPTSEFALEFDKDGIHGPQEIITNQAPGEQP